MMLQSAANAFRLPDLRNKILYTLGIVVIYRLAAAIPVPGVSSSALQQLSGKFTVFGMLSIFSGGSAAFSVVTMGVYPYITAQIAIQILQPVIPRLEEWSKEGEAGRQKLNQLTRIVTIPLALLQAFGQGVLLSSQSLITNFNLLNGATIWPSLGFMVTLTTGTMFLIWLGELITENGIGNGISLIIFVGIVARLPVFVTQQGGAGGNWLLLIVLAAAAAVVTAAIVFVQEGQRRIPVQYAKRMVRDRQTQGQSTHIPLRVNSAGMIPLIFAQSIVYTPGIIASYFTASSNKTIAAAALNIEKFFDPNYSLFYWGLYFVLVVGFTYFYTSVTFQQQRLAENLQRSNGLIPGLRPGKQTADYLEGVLSRITLAGALFLATIALLPLFGRSLTSTSSFTLTSTALLIVVGVVLDTMRQLEAQLLMRKYESFIR